MGCQRRYPFSEVSYSFWNSWDGSLCLSCKCSELWRCRGESILLRSIVYDWLWRECGNSASHSAQSRRNQSEVYGTSWQGKYRDLWNTRTNRCDTYNRKGAFYCRDRTWSERPAAFTWTNRGKRNQHLYSWWNAPCPCISVLKKILSLKREFRNRMAESTERVWSSSCFDSLHYQLSDAAKKQLCWQSIYNRNGCFPRCCSYRWKERFYACYWKGTGTGWLQGRSDTHRHQWRYKSDNRFWSCSHPVPCKHCNWSSKIRCNPSFLSGCRLWWC